MFKSELMNVLVERGLVFQATDMEGLDDLLSKKSVTAYIGFDCTAPSLHIGSLLQIIMLRHLQNFGHKPIILLGGATTRIGDPSGKDESRKILSDEEINNNTSGIKKLFNHFLSFGDNRNDAIIVNNLDWMRNINLIDFLREIGSQFTINQMLHFESVKRRLDREQPLSFLEFNYMIFQAYDFLKLNFTFDCELQLGGSDQWGNIVNGVDLIRKIENKKAFGLTSPLVTNSDGVKMGKTEAGAVWLDRELFSDFAFWQFWRNVNDNDVIKFLKMFTDVPLTEINRLSLLHGSELNDAKKLLADEVTAFCRGNEAAKNARAAAIETFEKGNISNNLPTVNIQSNGNTISIFDLFLKSGLVKSKSSLRRLVSQSGVKINDKIVDNANEIVHINHNLRIKLSVGRKNHVLVQLNS